MRSGGGERGEGRGGERSLHSLFSSQTPMTPPRSTPSPLRSRVGILDLQIANKRLSWLTTAPDGEVSFRADVCRLSNKDGPAYNPTVFHSFSNAPPPPIPMPPPPPQPVANDEAASIAASDVPHIEAAGESTAARGSASSSSSSSSSDSVRTHVAVGFVDLGTLAAAVNLPEWDEQVEAAERELQEAGAAAGVGVGGGRSSRTPLLQWVGFEGSPHAVAKTLVVERMMRAAGGGVKAASLAMQVGAESGWGWSSRSGGLRPPQVDVAFSNVDLRVRRGRRDGNSGQQSVFDGTKYGQRRSHLPNRTSTVPTVAVPSSQPRSCRCWGAARVRPPPPLLNTSSFWCGTYGRYGTLRPGPTLPTRPSAGPSPT